MLTDGRFLSSPPLGIAYDFHIGQPIHTARAYIHETRGAEAGGDNFVRG